MKQEVQIILTLEVDASKSKEDIKKFFWDMEQTYTETVSAKNRWEFSKISLVEIKEESEIYNTEGSIYEIDFSRYTKAEIKIENSVPTVLRAMNGHGHTLELSNIKIKKL